MHLRFLGATVLHEVDARQMQDHPSLCWRKFDYIVYNFPHAGFYGSEDNPDMINKHQGLVYDFFSNARWLLRHNGQIHVTHKIKPPYSFWNLEELAHQNSLRLMECVPFDIKDYPMYENKRGHSSTIDEPFNWKDSYTFIFTVAPPSPDISSSHFNLQGCRDALPRVKFVVKAEVRHFLMAAGYAGVLVDEYHSVRAMFWGPLPYMCVNFAELLAIKCALLMYERSHLCHRNVALDVESNSNVAISWIRSNFGNTLELSTELQEINMALGRIPNPVELFCCYGKYEGAHYHLVRRLAVKALDTLNMCERWIPDNAGY
uniref:25S rRNA (uridine-N(3))-methyltransferase BMT5-like domain-containing protein n=2 Tax=Chenopodium quinoa TaxID=63459 RepID=A0A803LL97_CHEQI